MELLVCGEMKRGKGKMRDDLISRKALMQSLRSNVLVDVTPHLEDAIEGQPTWISEETPPETPCYVLLSFDNFSMPLIGRYEEDEEGGAFYIGDDEESCISQDLIVNGWMPLPEPYREDEREELKQGYPEEKAGADALDAGMAADITQAIEYFEDELSQMKVFAEMVTFREEEKKSVETALKVLRGITENGKGQQGNQCATSHG